MEESIYRKPTPKYNVLYTDKDGKFKSQLIYTDAELDELIEKVDEEGGEVVRVYER